MTAGAGPAPDAASVHVHDTQLRLQAGVFEGDRVRSATAVRELFFDLVDLVGPELFVEAGAFEATASRRVRAAHPACRVIAFEANPHTYAEFAAATDFAALGVDYRHLALTDVRGPVRFHQEDPADPAVAGSSSTLPRNEDVPYRPDTPVATVEVPGAPLDEVVPTDVARTCLWVDVEGAARQVLSGAERLLANCRVLMVEVEELEFWQGQWHAVDVLGFLLARGFVPVARDIEYPYQYNVVWMRPEVRRGTAFADVWARFLTAAAPVQVPPHRSLPTRVRGRLAYEARTRFRRGDR